MTPGGRRLAALLTVAILVSACTFGLQSPTASPSPSAGAAWQPTTAWEKALATIDSTGHFTLDAALNLFATAFGPLPGATAQTDLTGIFDRTIAIDAVEEHDAELTAEQKTAIANYLAPPADAARFTISPVATGSANGGIVLAALTDEQKSNFKAAADNLRFIIADKLGHDMLGDFEVVYTDRPATEKGVLGQLPNGFAHGSWEGGVYSGCTINVYNQAVSAGEQVVRSLLAHEIFHCFQYDGYRTYEAKQAAPAWVKEGQAAWVGQTVGGVSGAYDRFWDEYLLVPTKPLVTRAYDAIGFYSHLDETGTSPWSTFQAMWAAGSDNIAIYKASGADNDNFVDSWASGVMRQPARNSAWDTTGPGITPSAYPAPSVGISDGVRIGVGAAFFTNDVTLLEFDVDMVHFEIDGHGRLNDGSLDTTELTDVWYCVSGHDCEKKCESAPDPPATAGVIAGTAALAYSGGLDGTVGTVEGKDVEKADCTSTPPPTPPDEPGICDSGCGYSNGDPHIGTIDDGGYDFQAVGEFVLLRSADGSFELQGRQQPYGDSDDVSINTGVAMKLGSHRAGIYIDKTTSALVAKVDGNPIDRTAPTDLGGGARISPTSAGYDVDFPDGSKLHIVYQFAQYGFNILLEPSAALRATATGLFGPVPAGDGLDVPALPDGTVLPDAADHHDYWQKLYVTFADAWRVTDATSLFDYGTGESTATFTIREFPPEPQMVTLADLTAEQRALGEGACKGIGLPFLREQCIFDVGITGDAGFFDMFNLTATLVDTGKLSGSGERYRVVNLYGDDQGGKTLDVYGWTSAGAALLATVDYEGISNFFDPGLITNDFGDAATRITIQRHGEPPMDFHLNLYDIEQDNVPGTVKTIVLAPGDPDSFGGFAGGREMISAELYEEHPGDQFLQPPLPDRGLLFVDTTGMTYTLDPTFFYLSVGDGCLTQPDFPTVPQRVGGGDGQSANATLAVPVGEHTLTLHSGPQAAEHSVCSSPPILPGVPLNLAAGGRAFLLPYASPPGHQLKVLVLPFGQ